MVIGNFIIFERKNDDRDETLKEFDKEVKKRKILAPFKWLKEKIVAAWIWAKAHPGEAIVIVTTAASGGYKLITIITKHRMIQHEEFVKNQRFYDRKRDQWVTSTRKLTNDELKYLERSYDEGISKRQALEDLGLLK